MITPHYIKTIAQTISPDATLVSGEEWQADVETNTLYYNHKDLVSDFSTGKVRALTIHESLHLKDTKSVSNKQYPEGKKENTQHYFNWLEDLRIETRLLKTQNVYHNSALYWGYYNIGQVTAKNKLDQIMLDRFYDLQSSRGYIVNVARSHWDIDRGQLFTLNQLSCFDTTQSMHDWFISDLLPQIVDMIPPDSKKQPMTSVKMEAVGSGDGIGGKKYLMDSEVYSLDEARALTRTMAVYVGNRIKAVLAQNSTIRYTGAKKRGRLLSKNVAKVLANARNIFSKRQTYDTPDYRIIVCLDKSGSVQGRGYQYELEAYALLEQTCKKVNLEFHSFLYGDHVREGTQENIEQHDFDGNTDDMQMMRRLNELKLLDDRTIVFLLTDGHGTIGENKRLFRKLLEKTQAQFIGIGFDRSRAAYSYGNLGIDVGDGKNLPKQILKMLKRIYTRR